MIDIPSIEGLGVIIEWCKTRGVMVEFVKTPNGGVYIHDEKRIKISCHLGPEKQLHTLLHECGHHLVETKERDSTDRFGNGYRSSDIDVTRTFVHQVDIIDEEFEAWARGLKLAERLNVDLSVERYNRTKADCIKTHLKAALKVDGYGHGVDNKEAKTHEA